MMKDILFNEKNQVNWLKKVTEAFTDEEEGSLCIIEIGAGKAVPTVRLQCESIIKQLGNKASFIRINPVDYKMPVSLCKDPIRNDLTRLVSLPLDALPALEAIWDLVKDNEIKKRRKYS